MHLLIGLPFPPFCSLLLPANPHVHVRLYCLSAYLLPFWTKRACVCVFRTAGGRFIRLNAGFMVQLKKGLGAFPPVLGPPHSHVKTHPSCSSDKGMKCVTRYTVTQAVLFAYCACSVYLGVCLNILFC